MTVAPPEAIALNDVVTAHQETLWMPDPSTLLVTLATVVGNRMAGDPIWLMLIGAPSSGKTEIVESFAELPEVHWLSSTTKAGLLSGAVGEGGTGGLLCTIGDRGLLIIKDFTTILSEHSSTRNEVLAIFREMFEGKFDRAVGTGGGVVLRWRGHVGCIACTTQAVDQVSMAAFGERWVRWRLPATSHDDRFLAGLTALENQGKQQDQRAKRQRVVADFLANLAIPDLPPPLTSREQERLGLLADLGTRCRSEVTRDGGSGDRIELIPDPEELPRLISELAQLSAGLTVIGVGDEDRWRLLVGCALGGMESLRRQAVDILLGAPNGHTTATIAARAGLPRTSMHRHLENLTALGVLDRIDGPPEIWFTSDWLRDRWTAVSGEGL
ncbi:MAG: helix-turn-helix domain-containing protein [Acidimicrobiales bacterium]|nr:helix-turn-helix domain-containing protein [Acidimicrobiales bacterium]